MPVKGVLITLEDDPDRAEAAIATLRGTAGIEVGEIKDKWLPLVVESPNEREMLRPGEILVIRSAKRDASLVGMAKARLPLNLRPVYSSS